MRNASGRQQENRPICRPFALSSFTLPWHHQKLPVLKAVLSTKNYCAPG
jgi:hypothetical protein